MVFKYGNGTISAKLNEEQWLMEFQNRTIDVRPEANQLDICNNKN